jgi:hypothetical protein
MDNLFEKLKKEHQAEQKNLAGLGYDEMEIVHSNLPLTVWYAEREDWFTEIVAIFCGDYDIRPVMSIEELKEIDEIVFKRHIALVPCLNLLSIRY